MLTDSAECHCGEWPCAGSRPERGTRCRELEAAGRKGDQSEAAQPRARGTAFPAEGKANAKDLLGESGGERAWEQTRGLRNQPPGGGQLVQRQVNREENQSGGGRGAGPTKQAALGPLLQEGHRGSKDCQT